MNITFLGAAHEVTGSCTMIEADGHRILVDCGMEQGKDLFENQKLPVRPSEIEAVLLTHAHIDHAGNLPLLKRKGFEGSVYTTDATAALSEVMLRDSAHIQEFEAEWRNRKAKRSGEKEYEPIYTMEDAEAVLRRFRPCRYGERIRILENVEICFRDAGHLLGSASVEIWVREGTEERKLLFSGDIGRAGRPILRDPQPITEGADCVVIESTYGDRLHEATLGHTGTLCEILTRTFRRGGNVVIPSFAVGRTQELLYEFRHIKEQNLVPEFPEFKVYMDSPLAGAATRIFMQCGPEHMDREAGELIRAGKNPFWFDGLRLAETSEESKAINLDEEPKVILSASGMCEAGRIRHHLKHNLWRPESTVLFVGYQTAGTLGRSLLDGAKKVRLFGEEVHVAAEIASLPGTSGHADRNELLAWLERMDRRPAMVIVNHGDPEACESFTELLREKGYTAEAPYSGTVYDPVREEFLQRTSGIPIRSKAGGRSRSAVLHDELVEAAEELLALTKRMAGRPNKELAAMTDRIRQWIRKES